MIIENTGKTDGNSYKKDNILAGFAFFCQTGGGQFHTPSIDKLYCTVKKNGKTLVQARENGERMFGEYCKIGWEHIINLGAYDHLLFIMALAAVYTFSDWKQVLVLITAFTIGHSLTLALGVFNVVKFSSSWIEFLIPCTIAATAVANIFQKKFTPKNMRLNYWLALFFGLIHGMAFANGLKNLLGNGSDILLPLLGFNIGVELGQIAVVLCILAIAFVCIRLLKISRREWVLFLSGGAFVSAIIMALERKPF